MTQTVAIQRYDDGRLAGSRTDEVAVEEPLEIRIEGSRIAVAMRTPGQDEELVAGWLVSEGIVRTRRDIADFVARPGEDSWHAAVIDVMLRDPAGFNAARHRRAVVTNASCGLCGAASVEQVMREFPRIEDAMATSAEAILGMPARLAGEQAAFKRTGGLHACGLFDATGQLLALREDVGRHNALDKLVGWALLADRLPLRGHVVLLSGRVSLEMMQKALAASVPVVAAIGAPSSLAVDLALRAGQTLVAFIRGGSMNVYAGAEKLHGTGRR
jgi:FdhD protein